MKSSIITYTRKKMNAGLWVVVFLLLTACKHTLTPSEKLGSILESDVDCTVPCWNTLVPGQSTETDFLKLVEESPTYIFNDMKSGNFRTEGVMYQWDDDSLKSFNWVVIQQGIVSAVQFQPWNSNFTLAMIEDVLGVPTSYGASQLGVEHIYIQLTLFYEKDGVAIEIWIPVTANEMAVAKSHCEFDVNKDAVLEKIWIYLMEPSSAERMIEGDYVGGFNNPTHRPQSWIDENPIPLTLCP